MANARVRRMLPRTIAGILKSAASARDRRALKGLRKVPNPDSYNRVIVFGGANAILFPVQPAVHAAREAKENQAPVVGAASARIFRQRIRARRLRGSRARLRARRCDAEPAFARSA